MELQHQSFQWMFRIDSFRMDWFDLLAVQGTLKSLLQHHRSKASVLQCSVCSALHTAGGILVLRPGIKLSLPEVEMQSLNCWTAREVPGSTSIPRCWMLYTKVCGSRRSLLYHLGSPGNRLSYEQQDTESEAAPERVWTHPEGDLLSTVGSEPFLVSRACGPDLSVVLQVTSLGCVFHRLHPLQFGEPLVLENIVFSFLQSLLQPYCPMRLISEISINS